MSALEASSSVPTAFAEQSHAASSIDAGTPENHASFETASSEQSSKAKLQGIAARIRLNKSRSFTAFLDSGQCLCEAKNLLAHGEFENWCYAELNYSKSTAENLMRVAKVLGPRLKNITVTAMPSPSLLYRLSARSTPEDIRDEFLPRVIAGDEVGPALRTALKQHRDKLKAAKATNVDAEDAEAQAAMAAVQRDGAVPDVRGGDPRCVAGQQEAKAAAVTLIAERFGDALPILLEHVAQAGPGCIFSLDVEHELQARLTMRLAPTVDDGASLPGPPPMPPEASSEELATALDNEAGSPGDGAESVIETAPLLPNLTADAGEVRQAPLSIADSNTKTEFTHFRGPGQALIPKAKSV